MKKQPNIVLVISDDQGYWSLGCGGNKEIITPNIDRLAEDGIRFENFFCTSPVCSPARASLLTGAIPSQHGIHDWLRDDDERQAALEYLAGQYSYTKALAENGYCCGLSGKWHMGAAEKAQQGFTHWFSHKSGGGPYYGAPMYKDGKLYREERYVTDAITEDAVEFLESRKDSKQPFYLHVAYTAPHGPWLDNHPKEYTDLYKDCPFESVPHLPRHPDSIYLTDEVAKDERGNLIGYFAAVTAMDAGIGRILDKLDELNLADDTIFVFTSDNGFSCGHHGFWGKGNATFPLNMYEESVKVPFIIRHPGHIPKGKVYDGLISAYDFMPTLLDYLGLKPSDTMKRPGVSFAPLLRGEDFVQREDVVVLDEYGPNRMIRGRRFKYVARYPYGPNELYDLETDPGETKNLLKEGGFEDLEKDMRLRLETWFAAYVNPEIDGVREAVFGSGQTGLAGLWGKGVSGHSLDDYIRENPNFAPYEIK